MEREKKGCDKCKEKVDVKMLRKYIYKKSTGINVKVN